MLLSTHMRHQQELTRMEARKAAREVEWLAYKAETEKGLRVDLE